MKKVVFLLTIFIGCCFFATHSAAQVILTFAGTGASGFSGDDGPATIAQLVSPSGVAVDKAGNVYITDQNNSRIRKVDLAGIITTIAGTGVAGDSGDGTPATAAMLFWPTGLAIDDTGNIFIADQFNNVIRKVSAATGIISTIAGDNALVGFDGDGGPATNATLWHPADVGVDRSGNVYIVDQDNSTIRKVNAATGIITSVAGVDTAGYSGDDGPATAAKLNFPQGIAVDSIGTVYIADFYNSRVRKIDAITGIITTVVGNGTQGYSGDGGPATNAELYDASALAIDDSGNIYVSDYYNNMIRKVSAATGFISTIAGNGTAAYCCDCNLATNAEMNYPEGVAVDGKGNVYIADFGNSRVRKVTDSFFCLPLAIDQNALLPALNIFPNPNSGIFTLKGTIPEMASSGEATFEVLDMLGRILHSEVSPVTNGVINKQIIVSDNIDNGVYIIRVKNDYANKVLRFTLDR